MTRPNDFSKKKNIPEILILGRPNVGKSTLFNRLAGRSLALVDNQPGSTRDLKSFDVEWNGFDFTMTDSGGWVPGEKDSIALKVGSFLEERIRRVRVLLLVMDGLEGLTPADEWITRAVRKYGLPTWLVVNKVDRFEVRDEAASEFARLGFDHVFPISAMHGIGLDDLLDSLTDALKRLPARKEPIPDPQEGSHPMRIAILGKPNVGKSSIVNSILGEKRVLEDDLPGTTHDAIPVILETDQDSLVLVDTAGIRQTKQQDSRIEKLSVEQSLHELQTCQVVLFLLDGEKGITHQDVTISRIIGEAFRPVVIVINKWDIHPHGAEQARAERIAKRELRSIYFAPVLFVSARTGLNLEKVLPFAKAVYEESCKKIPTRKVNLALQEAISKQSPPFRKGHQIKVLYGFQRPGHPPAFEIFVNQAQSAAPTYVRYLESELRKSFDMENTPLQVVLKEKADKKEFKPKGFKRNFNPTEHRRRSKKHKRESE
ncbi:MAG TPA: ribosome biogenesis GTPase Der [bacterium]|nr:ribosome biogenesis GTPase Der [bacterium]